MNRAGRDLLENVEEAGKARRDRVGAAQLDALARGDTGDRAEHREAMVAARVDDTAAQPCRNASDPEAVARRPDVTADAPELLDDAPRSGRTP